MRRFIITITAVVFSIGATFAQKYIVVDSEKIFRSIAEYNSAITTLDGMAKEYQQKVDKAYAEVESMYNAYISQKQSLSVASQQAKEQEILDKERKVAEYQQSVFGNDGLIMKKRIELIQPIQKLVFSTIEEYAKAKGYDMVIDISQNATMLYYSPKADHTEAIIAELKKKENK